METQIGGVPKKRMNLGALSFPLFFIALIGFAVSAPEKHSMTTDPYFWGFFGSILLMTLSIVPMVRFMKKSKPSDNGQSQGNRASFNTIILKGASFVRSIFSKKKTMRSPNCDCPTEVCTCNHGKTAAGKKSNVTPATTSSKATGPHEYPET